MNKLFLSLSILIHLLSTCDYLSASEQSQTIEKWAEELGRELYDLGIAITNRTEMMQRYKTHNAIAESRNPQEMLMEIKENIERMVDRKIDAVRCIQIAAENEAFLFEYDANVTDFDYYNSKFSPVNDEKPVKIPAVLEAHRRNYKHMTLNNDTHFYNIPVNTSYSSVHIPLNIYDQHKGPQSTIQWSEALDRVFVQNYKSDPSLSWQYFGSSTGVMRHYPAMRWTERKDLMDLFDCRIRTWFIEAATCTKDVIILIDSSGSMQGMRKHIATLTISSILDTFSNNDYINVMNYSMGTNFTVPCFEDMLVQATRENLNTFKKAVAHLDPDNKSNSSIALEAAFALLEKYRTPERCGPNLECNQMIMLVTDGIAGNLSSVFELYNRVNGSIPVRIFTYLIGLEVTNVNEIMWAACTNRGYYSHVESLEEVTGSVFKYIPVIARPLVLQDVHPVSWTHAYADTTYDDATDNVFNEPYRLLTSVAVPAFDKKINLENDTMTAELLGVAATDVPIDEIRRLTLPYKIGVMGYAFLVSNNGYVIMHPSFRPVFNKTILKENYNSVDFMEVEQHDYTLKYPREIDKESSVYKLRDALVHGEKGSFHNATLKYHYDNIRRITRQKYDYYYAEIEGTPFSLGLALPQDYGNLYLNVSDQVQRSAHRGENVSLFLKDIFKGSNWRIHPKWVYCKYHYLEGHEFDTPEQELRHFLDRINGSAFLDHRQHIATAQHWDQDYNLLIEDNDEVECGRMTLGEEEYYCDNDLMKLLIFDAKITMNDFDDKWKFATERDEALFMSYNATLRFVATMSGLTRWEYIFGEDENTTKTEFGDWHARAIDETWYKSAVLQHQHDDNSSVFSVPFEVGDQPDTLVTSSYAIFYQDGKFKVPVATVGFQFSHKHFRNRFFQITSKTSGNAMACGDLLDCYVIDNSGYIIISPNANDTGKFFGEVEGAVFDSMLAQKIFEEIRIYDFQGWCLNDTVQSSDVGRLQTPVDLILTVINGFFANIIWFFMRTQVYQLWDPNFVFGEVSSTPLTPITEEDHEEPIVPDEPETHGVPVEEEQRSYYPCDLQRNLSILNQTMAKKYKEEVPTTCSRPFFMRHIQNTNLLLIAVIANASECDRFYTTDPAFVDYPPEIEHPCQKINLTVLPRGKLKGCYNSHPDEIYIDICGRSTRIEWNQRLFIAAIILFVAIIIDY